MPLYVRMDESVSTDVRLRADGRTEGRMGAGNSLFLVGGGPAPLGPSLPPGVPSGHAWVGVGQL